MKHHQYEYPNESGEDGPESRAYIASVFLTREISLITTIGRSERTDQGQIITEKYLSMWLLRA